MRGGWLNVPIVLFSVALASAALADGKGDKSKKDSASSSESADTGKAKGPKKDPKGQTGISPFMELVNEGSASYVAQDYAKAADTFQKAIEKAPDRPLGHYLLGEAYLADKKPEQAEQAWQAALRTSDKDKPMKAKVLFVLADLRERQGKLQDAAAAWKEYQSFVGANPGAGYPATPTARQTAITTHDDLAQKYAKVKERIEQRQREASEPKK